MKEWKDLTEKQKEEATLFIGKKIEKQYAKLEKQYGGWLAMSILFRVLSEILKGRTYLKQKEAEKK